MSLSEHPQSKRNREWREGLNQDNLELQRTNEAFRQKKSRAIRKKKAEAEYINASEEERDAMLAQVEAEVRSQYELKGDPTLDSFIDEDDPESISIQGRYLHEPTSFKLNEHDSQLDSADETMKDAAIEDGDEDDSDDSDEDDGIEGEAADVIPSEKDMGEIEANREASVEQEVQDAISKGLSTPFLQQLQETYEKSQSSRKLKLRHFDWTHTVDTWHTALATLNEKKRRLSTDGWAYIEESSTDELLLPHQFFSSRERAILAGEKFLVPVWNLPGPTDWWPEGDEYLFAYKFRHNYPDSAVREAFTIMFKQSDPKEKKLHPTAHRIIPSDRYLLTFTKETMSALDEQYSDDFIDQYCECENKLEKK